jgi:hypothetical protein
MSEPETMRMVWRQSCGVPVLPSKRRSESFRPKTTNGGGCAGFCEGYLFGRNIRPLSANYWCAKFKQSRVALTEAHLK